MTESPEPTGRVEASWLEPYPDALLEIPDPSPGPEPRYDSKETFTLAFAAALQLLPPRQRAVLLLRDVLGFRGSEVAHILETTEASVNTGLQRARETLERRLPPGGRERAPLPNSSAECELVDRFAEAFQNGEIDNVIALLTEDATFTMPPEPLAYQGHDAITRFLANRFSWRRTTRSHLIATRANTQPAFACYLQDPHAPIARAYGMIVLTLEGDRIGAVTRFLDNSLLPRFGLPRTIRS